MQGTADALALGSTCRYKSKYITTVLYKASGRAEAPVAQAEPPAERTMGF